ncbi:MAG: cell surface protein [Muribaculaceae bacterium]|nr:cell surface protein [Muribaculaceae bacterium]
MKVLKPSILIALAITLFTSCNNGMDNTSIGVDSNYSVYRLQKLIIATGAMGDEFKWEVTSESGNTTLLSEDRECIFVAEESGSYALKLTIKDGVEEISQTSTIIVLPEDIEYKASMTKVLEFNPAPGQFINDLPEYEEGDTKESIRQKTEEYLLNGNIISLGSFGGYIIVGFDHTILNKEGKDIIIKGNATTGSAEPGIVSVSIDKNNNGIADDEWYELAGSEYNNPETKKNYQVTYYRHDENKLPIMGENGVINKEYIKWEDNMGNSGFIEQNNFTNHTPEYWPKWSNSNTITVSGTLLPKNYIIKSNGQYFLNKYEWGYADNHANRYIEDNSFDISWAVNRNGEKVNIKGIDFIKITTALLQNCGQIGEASTEFAGAEDLNLTQ